MSVVLGLFLCAVLPMINAACFTVGHKFCQDTTDKTWHPTGSVWRNSKCLDCNCSSESMSCYGKTLFIKYPCTCGHGIIFFQSFLYIL
uniref:Uncharacterized protein n=1 Tax=Cyprinus carpio carpio TaxID=630221 RepID=A0A9J8C1Q0_CYPCA